MKVALLLSGQFRTANQCYQGIKTNILDKYNPDVFISTWSSSEFIKPAKWFGRNFDDDCTIEDIKNIYNPISIDIERFDDENKKPFANMAMIVDSKIKYGNSIHSEIHSNTINSINTISMWYKRFKVNMLKRQYEFVNGKYDLVIYSRFDLDYLQNLECVIDNKLHIPQGFDWHSGINDLMAYGSSDAMDLYCDVFPRISQYRLQDDVSPTPEVLLRHHLEKMNIDVERFVLQFQLRGANIWEMEISDLYVK